MARRTGRRGGVDLRVLGSMCHRSGVFQWAGLNQAEIDVGLRIRSGWRDASEGVAVVARDTFPADLSVQAHVSESDSDGRMATETGAAGSSAKVRLCQLQCVLKYPTLHRPGMRRIFPGFENGAMAAAAQFSARWSWEVGCPGWRQEQQ